MGLPLGRGALPPAPPCPHSPLHHLPPSSSFLPRNVAIIGYARTALTDQQLRDKLRPRLKGSEREQDAFLERCTYVAGGPRCCCGLALRWHAALGLGLGTEEAGRLPHIAGGRPGRLEAHLPLPCRAVLQARMTAVRGGRSWRP